MEGSTRTLGRKIIPKCAKRIFRLFYGSAGPEGLERKEEKGCRSCDDPGDPRAQRQDHRQGWQRRRRRPQDRYRQQVSAMNFGMGVEVNFLPKKVQI